MKNIVIGILVVGLLGSLGGIWWLSQQQKSVGVVRLNDVFEQYEGSKKAAAKFTKSAEQMEATMDSLRGKLQFLEAKGAEESVKLAVYHELQNYGQQAEAKYQEMNGDLSQEVQNQINTYLELYRSEKGYDMILSQYNNTGVIALGESVDVTDDFIASLNKYYFGEEAK